MAVRDSASLLVGLVLLFHTWGAWAAVEVNTEDRVEVIRGETAQLNAIVTADDGIIDKIIQWFYVTPTGVRQRIYYQDHGMKIVEKGTQFSERITVNSTGDSGGLLLIITDVQLKDELQFVFVIKGAAGSTNESAEGRTNLKVFESPDLPTFENVQTGIVANEFQVSKIATCEVKNGYPKPSLTWYKNNMQLKATEQGSKVNIMHSSTSESSGLFSVRSELSMTVTKEDKDAEFYCEATYSVPAGSRMTETGRFNITVLYPSTAVNVWVESPKGKIKEGDSVELHCKGNGNMPSIISIKKADAETSLEQDMVVLENVTRLTSGLYQCSSLDTESFEEVKGNTNVFVNYMDPAVVMPEEDIVAFQGEEVMATCNALSSLQTHTIWMKNGKQVSEGHTLVLKDASFETAGLYVCLVSVPEIEEMETSATFKVNVLGPPEILEPKETDIWESYESMVTLVCRVTGFPYPSIIWSTDGKTSSELTSNGIESELTVKVSSDMTVFCNASNKFGKDSAVFNIIAKGSGVIIAVIIICILLLAILGSVLYFLYKRGKICGRSGKQDLTKDMSNKDNIVVEIKSDNTEEAVLLGVNGEKQPPNNQ